MRTRILPFAVLACCLTAFRADAAPAVSTQTAPKPYRVLVIIGDQWDDPGSYVIDARSRFGGRTRQSAKDFLDVITMLKIWGIPFDILRLDQQRLQINRFLNGAAEPNYACLIWMADPSKLHGFSANYETVRRAVEDYGMSLIGLFDYIRAPEIAKLFGVECQGLAAPADTDSGAGLRIAGNHFITAGAVGTAVRGKSPTPAPVVACTAGASATVLGTIGKYPQLVVRDVNERTKTVWIGGGHDWFDTSPVMRQLFRKALVHGIGYGLFNDNFENAYIFIMDDMGCSEHAYSLRWHYPTPSKEIILKYLVEPLQEHGFVMVQNTTPGYANPVTRMVENPWTIKKFKDPFGNVQDYGSTKEGLDEGVRRGVFEIQAHRAWTHMVWDLDSAPGPWWDPPVDGEMANGLWYNETYDTRRDVPVPSNDMLFIYRIGRDAIQRQFGLTPLSVNIRPGVGLETDNGRLAVIAGYGVDRWHYLGRDRVIQFSISGMCPEEFTCHDLDLTAKTDGEITSPEKDPNRHSSAALIAAPVVGTRSINLRSREWIESKKDKRWMGFNEYCAYLHSTIEMTESGGLQVRLDYDPYYCRHFAQHPSRWTLEFSDRYLAKMGKQVAVTIDGKTEVRAGAQRQRIELSSSVGSRKVDIRPKQ